MDGSVRPPAAAAGIGLRAPHYREIAERRPPLGLLEVHSENFFAAGGPALGWLERLRADYAVSLHGVGLSLGSADPLDERHLAKLAALIEKGHCPADALIAGLPEDATARRREILARARI